MNSEIVKHQITKRTKIRGLVVNCLDYMEYLLDTLIMNSELNVALNYENLRLKKTANAFSSTLILL